MMKVSELMKKLEHMDPNDEIVFAYPYGDYWGSIVISTINEVEFETVYWSDYHNRYRLVEDTYSDDYDKGKHAVVLKG